MDQSTKGAWLLAQSKSLDAVTGPSAARLENIAYAGRVGRLYNLLRRNVPSDPNPTISAGKIKTVCQLNNIGRASRDQGLAELESAGRIDIATNGAISVLGATTKAVLETAANIFDNGGATPHEEAVLELSEVVATKPLARKVAITRLADIHKIPTQQVVSIIDLCRETAIIDEEGTPDRRILFNSNTFRDGKFATKAFSVLQGLKPNEQEALSEVQEKLTSQGTMYEQEVKAHLGSSLYRRLLSVGLFDRMEVSNSEEAVGYIASPKDFQKYGRPFEEDPIDDAKALLASLTYGRTRSHKFRGRITLPEELLRALITGREVGGPSGVRAIGEDYRELERRQVVQVTPRSSDGSRCTFRLLKKDVGELALTLVRGEAGAEEALLMDGHPVTSFKGPHRARTEIRRKNTVGDRRFVAEAIDRLRTGE